MYLYGKHSVYERLKVDPKSVKEIYLDDNFGEPQIETLIRKNKIPHQTVSKQRLLKISTGSNFGGIVAKVSDFGYTDFDDLLKEEKSGQFSFIFLDRVFDPQNLGAILRTAACFGKFAVVIPKHKACCVTEAVLRVSCGGENYVPVSRVVNMRNALFDARDCGYWAVGTTVGEAETIDQVQLPFPLSIVFGSEGKGLRYGLKKHVDKSVSIPMQGAGLSFNITAACAIICYEIVRQRPS
jgi:23S rRNA (guanosine2251-2'-O)-methyltransferase